MNLTPGSPLMPTRADVVATIAAAPQAKPRLQSLSPGGPKPKRDEDVFILCMPTRGTISAETFTALTCNDDGARMIHAICSRKPVVEARNELAAAALRTAEANPLPWEPRNWYVLWVDDDAYWPPNTLRQLKHILREYPGIDIVAGFFGARMPFVNPIAFRNRNNGESFPSPGRDCALGDLVEVQRVGFHFVAHRLDVLKKVGSDPFTLPQNIEDGVTEDFAFCDRATAAGCRIVCATALPIAHVDPQDGATYVPGAPVLRVDNNRLVIANLQHVGPNGLKQPEKRNYGEDVDAVFDKADKLGGYA